MTLATFNNEIKEAIPRLFEIAGDLTWNNLSENYKFILTEIEDSNENLYRQRKINKQLNDKKVPVSLAEFMPAILELYDNFYDINLQVYRATKSMTIIDFRYYPKSSLDPDYRKKVLNNPPMLHCKIAIPPWLSDKKKKFDINWEHDEWLKGWKIFWLKLKRL